MSGQTTGWVLRNGPSDRAMHAVLITIADAANRDGEHAHPGINAMVEGSKYGRRTVFNALRRLADEGWIEVTDQGGGRGLATVYRVCTERVQPLHGSPEETVQSATPKRCNPEPETVQSTTTAPYLSAVDLPTEELQPAEPARDDVVQPTLTGRVPGPRKPPFDAAFDAWWIEYPRKADRAEARRRYVARRRSGCDEDRLLRAARNYSEASVGTEPRVVKLAATFLTTDDGPWSEWVDGAPRQARARKRKPGPEDFASGNY
jgi:hypothetical protein